MPQTMPAAPRIAPCIVHGLDVSYFTGKLEAYLRAKGMPYTLVPMTAAAFSALARHTGVRQMPQLHCADGRWLTDTTCIIDVIEAEHPDPAITPASPALAFLAHLLEDFGDEFLWRPAMYYRWAHAADRRLLGGQIAQAMLPRAVPRALGRRLIALRQRRMFMFGDGVTRQTAPVLARQYRRVLAALEAALQDRPFLLGARPSQADFGVFGPMFRHFFCDPTPAAIMRATAPRVLAWVGRLWAISPADFAQSPLLGCIPAGLDALARMLAVEFLPYMAANEAGFAGLATTIHWQMDGATFITPVSPYRVWRLHRTRARWHQLGADDQAQLAALLGQGGIAVLQAPALAPAPSRPRAGAVDSQWTGLRAPGAG